MKVKFEPGPAAGCWLALWPMCNAPVSGPGRCCSAHWRASTFWLVLVYHVETTFGSLLMNVFLEIV